VQVHGNAKLVPSMRVLLVRRVLEEHRGIHVVHEASHCGADLLLDKVP
jgi:hypothetical protein